MKKLISINYFKKTIISIGLFLMLGLFNFNFVAAQAAGETYNFATESGLNATSQGAGYTATSATPEVIVGRVIQIVLGFLGVAFFAFMLYAGITWMTAQGNEQKVEKAKTMITEAIVGLIIVMAAYAISYFVINYFST